MQFDLSTWREYKPAGALDNPAQATKEQQIAAAMAGIQARGDPQSLWPQNWGQLGWGMPSTHDTGLNAGPLPQGLTLVNNQTGSTEQAMVLNQQQLQAVSGAQVHQLKPSPTPSPQVPDFQRMAPSQPSAPGASAGRAGAAGGVLGETPKPTVPAPPPVRGGDVFQPDVIGRPQDKAPEDRAQGPTRPGEPGMPETGMHVLPALQTAIMSTAQTIGSLAALAINLGAQAAAAGISSLGGIVQGCSTRAARSPSTWSTCRRSSQCRTGLARARPQTIG